LAITSAITGSVMKKSLPVGATQFGELRTLLNVVAPIIENIKKSVEPHGNENKPCFFIKNGGVSH
jgi:hypothetical protein